MNEDYQVPAWASKQRCYDECVAELEREIAVRKRCYTRWVADGRLSAVDAADRYERLKGCLLFMADNSPDTLPEPESTPQPQ